VCQLEVCRGSGKRCEVRLVGLHFAGMLPAMPSAAAATSPSCPPASALRIKSETKPGTTTLQYFNANIEKST
jgi:hypothetical protein